MHNAILPDLMGKRFYTLLLIENISYHANYLNSETNNKDRTFKYSYMSYNLGGSKNAVAT